MAGRHFPPPWTAEETDACFIVKDHNGQERCDVRLVAHIFALCRYTV
jgi:hypothetical protein